MSAVGRDNHKCFGCGREIADFEPHIHVGLDEWSAHATGSTSTWRSLGFTARTCTKRSRHPPRGRQGHQATGLRCAGHDGCHLCGFRGAERGRRMSAFGMVCDRCGGKFIAGVVGWTFWPAHVCPDGTRNAPASLSDWMTKFAGSPVAQKGEGARDAT